MKPKGKNIILLTNSPEETIRLGKSLADGLKKGDIVALKGELGSGKTCLAQGIAKGLGVSENYVVTSPTFTLINEYPGKKMHLYHMDAYRLSGCVDLEEMGYYEYLLEKGVMVIEWPEKISSAIPDHALLVHMTYVEEKIRRIEISGSLEQIGVWEPILKKEI